MVARKKSNLQQQTSNYRINKDGTTVISIKECAKLLGIHRSTLYSHFKAVGKKEPKLVQFLSQYGFEVVGFFENGIPDTAFGLIAEYYATKANHTTEQAKILHQALTAIGARKFIKNRAKEEKSDLNLHSQYLETYHDLMGTLKERECTKPHYAIVNKGINDACGIEKGKRNEMTPREKAMMLMCQGAAQVKLIDRPQDTKWKAVHTSVTAAKEAVKSLDYGDYPELLPM